MYGDPLDDKNEPFEKAVQTWKLDTDSEGKAEQQLKAAEPGQYRLSYKVTDAKKHTIEGGYLFTIGGEGFDGHQYRFNDIELITAKREYAPGEKVKLQINTNQKDSVVALFIRPTNGVYLPPKIIRLQGKSVLDEVAVVRFCETRMPYFAVPRFLEFVDTLPTTENGKIQKYKLRERGITERTWDREAAGITVKRR